MSDVIGSVFEWIINAFSSLFETLFDAIITMFTTVKDLVFNFFDSNSFDLSSLGKSFMGLFERIFNGDFFSSDSLFIVLGLIVFVFIFKLVWQLLSNILRG